MKTRSVFICLFLVVCVGYNKRAFSQTDTIYLLNHEVIIGDIDPEFNMKRRTLLIIKNAEWIPVRDTVFFQDHHVFRNRIYNHCNDIKFSIDTFYQYPYDDGTIYISSVVINIGKICIVQSLFDVSTVKRISIYMKSTENRLFYTDRNLANPDSVISFERLRLFINNNFFIEKIYVGESGINDTDIGITPSNFYLNIRPCH